MSTNRQTVESMFRRHCKEVRDYIASKFGTSCSDPDDVIQTVFERLVAHPNLSSIGNPRAFLFAAARNVAIDERRRLASWQRFERCAQSDRRFTAIDELTPERVILSTAALDKVAAVIDNLPDDCREILRLSRIEGLSNTEIARRRGVSEAAIRRRITKILLQMHDALDSGS